MATGNVMLVFAAAVLGVLVGLQRRVSGGVLAPMLTHVTWSLGMLFILPPLMAALGWSGPGATTRTVTRLAEHGDLEVALVVPVVEVEDAHPDRPVPARATGRKVYSEEHPSPGPRAPPDRLVVDPDVERVLIDHVRDGLCPPAAVLTQEASALTPVEVYRPRTMIWACTLAEPDRQRAGSGPRFTSNRRVAAATRCAAGAVARRRRGGRGDRRGGAAPSPSARPSCRPGPVGPTGPVASVRGTGGEVGGGCSTRTRSPPLPANGAPLT